MHVYINKNKVLLDINTKQNELGGWKYLDILIFENKKSTTAYAPESFVDLIEKLKDVDKVYSFHEVETNLHGAVAYDIIINE